MNRPDAYLHLGAEQVRDPAPAGSREAGLRSQPEEVAAARPVASPPGGPRSLDFQCSSDSDAFAGRESNRPALFPDAKTLLARAMELSGFDPEKAHARIALEWIWARDQMTLARVLCARQARLEKSQSTL